MVRGLDRATLEIGVERDAASGKWYFVILGARRKVMQRSEPLYETDPDARAAARDWLLQIMLR